MAENRKSRTVIGTSRLEWAAAAIGAAILAATVAYLVYYGLTRPEGPPVIRLETLGIEESGGGYRVGFTAHNEGNATAADLHVSGRLIDGDSEVERSDALIDFLPQESSRGGGLFFTRDPRTLRLELRAEGYVEP